jgi:signal transduction histidine kinase
VHDDDVAMMRARWGASIASGEPYEIIYRLRRADGAYRWFVGRAAASHDEQGRVLQWFGSCTDIHDEVLVRERLQRLNTVAEALAGARDVEAIARAVAAEGIAALDANAGRLAVVRDDGRMLELYGADAVPLEIAAAWRTFPLDMPVPMATAARTGEPLYLASLEEAVTRFPAARDAMESMSIGALAVLPLVWGGQRLGAISFDFRTPRTFDPDTRTFLDTLARQCAQALERARLFALEQRARADAETARAEAQRANLAKGDFLAMMSHDLRTPINATLGYVDLMAMEIRGPLTEEQRHDLERMRRSQRALLALVNEVLDFTSVEAGRAECRRDPLALRDVVGDVTPIVEALAVQRSVRFEVAPVPDVVAIGDRDRVRQVLLNLLSNAVKFTDAGGSVRLTSEVAGDRVRIDVTDTGRGIPSDRLASVFEPFVQVDRDQQAASREGVGLGLAIARELARAMGGDLTAESEVGKGSTFRLELPKSGD